MSKWFAVGLLLVVACSEDVAESTAGAVSASTTIAAPSTTASPPTTSTTQPVAAAGHLIKLDPLTLEPVPGLDPFPLMSDSWTMLSVDQSSLLRFEWDERVQINYGTVIDVEAWEQIGRFELGPHTGRVVLESTLYAYDHVEGHLLAVDVRTGEITTVATWPQGLWLWDDLHVLSNGRIAALGTASADTTDPTPEYSVFVYDPNSAATTEIPVGEMERVNEHTGVFDGDYEIPDSNSPGVAWGRDRVYVVHADGPEVLEVDVEAGGARIHTPDLNSWWDRLWATWIPAASAKGPSLGTYTSAALSPDGRHLYISGNRQVVETAADGSLIDTSEHMGLMVIDTETWEAIDTPDLTIQFVRSSNGQVLGTDTISLQPWIDHLYVLSVSETGMIETRGPFANSSGLCESSGGGHLICFDYGSTATRIRVIDVETQATIAERAIGSTDVLHANGVLEDWPPLTDN